MTATCRRRRSGGWLAPWPGEPDPLPSGLDELADRLAPGDPADHALAGLWISPRDAAILESRYYSGTDRSQLRMTRTARTVPSENLPSEMVRAAGRRLPGRIVYSEDDGSKVEISKVGMETELRLTYREIREPLEAALFEPARFHLPTLDAGRLAGAASVERAFAGGAGR